MVGENRKLSGYDFYREILGSPTSIVAPMVDQSELPWRILSRRYGAQLVYTPMINAKIFASPSSAGAYRQRSFDIAHGEEGGPSDRPLIVQFCGNDPNALLASAKMVEPYCDAVDINLGCPQDIAKRGNYGSYLQDDWDLVYSLINILHRNLNIPVTAKFRVFPTVERTVEYAKMLERAGAQILSCHGRTREQRGHNSGLADWAKIAAVKAAVSVPVFANGNILYHSDIGRCLAVTKADGVMSAEGQLYNAALFSGRNPCHADLALEYLDIVRSLKTRTAPSAIKGHMFKLMRPALELNKDLREKMGKIAGKGPFDKVVEQYVHIAAEMKARIERDVGAEAIADRPDFVGNDSKVTLPYWVAQPYFRPLPQTGDARESPARTSDTVGTVVKELADKDCAVAVQDATASLTPAPSPMKSPQELKRKVSDSDVGQGEAKRVRETS